MSLDADKGSYDAAQSVNQKVAGQQLPCRHLPVFYALAAPEESSATMISAL